jgi:hypothetical protein
MRMFDKLTAVGSQTAHFMGIALDFIKVPRLILGNLKQGMFAERAHELAGGIGKIGFLGFQLGVLHSR